MPRRLNRDALSLAGSWPGWAEWMVKLLELLLDGNFIQQRSYPKQHVPFLLLEPPRKRGQRKEKHPNPVMRPCQETDQQQFRATRGPEGDSRGQRPGDIQSAAKYSFGRAELLGDRRQAQAAPSAAENFHVLIAPTRVRFVLPSFGFQFGENALEKGIPIQAALRPVADLSG